jgi:hypothetical protein
MLERIMEEYHRAFAPGFDEKRYIEESQSIRRVAKKAATASWKTFATETGREALGAAVDRQQLRMG